MAASITGEHDDSLDRLPIALTEGHRTLDHQIDAYENQSGYAIEIAKISLLIGAFVIGYGELSGISIPQWALLSFSTPLVLSIILSFISFGLGNYIYGFDNEGFLTLVNDLDEIEEKSGPLMMAYGTWAKENYSRAQRVRRIQTMALGSLMVSLGAFIGWLVFFA